MRKLLHLQVVRAIAASLVVVDHSFGELEARGVPCHPYIVPGHMLGFMGITAFFVLSGFIMVRQTSREFGVPGSPFRFAYRRILRIVPMYWLATLFWFAYYQDWGRSLPSPAAQLLLSLTFVPDYLAHTARMFPVVAQGWTLNYEMGFYLLFSLALFFPRLVGTLLLLVVPILLVVFGHLHHLPPDSIAGFYTDPLVLFMAPGVLVGLIETEVKRAPRIRWLVSPAFLLLVPTALLLAAPFTLGRRNLWVPVGLFSALVVLVCTRSEDTPLSRFGRTLVLLGDASYSTYLFHLFLPEPMFRAYASICAALHTTPDRPLLFAFLSVILANLIGLLIHVSIERPLTAWLRRLHSPPLRPILPG